MLVLRRPNGTLPDGGSVPTLPPAQVKIVPGAGHALPTDQPALVAERILKAAGQ